MAQFVPRLFPQIMGDMVARIVSVTPITDINYGSVLTTMLEAAAQEDDEQYFQMLEIIRGYSLDSISSTDLDNRAEEYGLTRRTGETASTKVTIGDSSVTKVSTTVFSGLPGPVVGSMSVNASSANGFPASGSIVIGRNTPNVETVAYTSITDNTSYYTFNLSAALANDHGTDETIVLAQGGDRLIPAGTVVYVPSSDINPKIEFSLDADATILNGEPYVTGVSVTALESGSSSNVPVGSISQFDSLPFSTATVTNPSRVTNGKDEETDQELRDRIKDTIQSLSRGTGKSIINGTIGLVSELENKRVVSASIIEPTIPADVVKLFIDDGTGFVPSFASVGYEEIVANATGGEKFLYVANYPIVKAFVETQNQEPFDLSGGEDLFVEVGGKVETIQFLSTDFETPGEATAQEVLAKINKVAVLFEARVSSDGEKLKIFSRSNTDEQIKVTGGTANEELAFPTDQKYTSKLYLRRNNAVTLLSKDGITASLECQNSAGYDFSLHDHNLVFVVDGKNSVPNSVFFTVNDFANAASASASEVMSVINNNAFGLTATATSNESRVTVSSNTLKSENSKIRVVENFDAAYLQSGLAYTNILSPIKTGLINITLFSSINSSLYLGHSSVLFETIYFNLAVTADVPMEFDFEYWNGTTWAKIGVSDGTEGFTQSGFIIFKAPRDWALTTVSSTTQYWIRITRTGAIATNPVESTIKICTANDMLGFSESEKVGQNKDYTINRFIGQIELESTLQVGDQVTLGMPDTRAYIVSSVAPYGLVGGETLTLEIDGIPQTVTFEPSDFTAPGTALASEVLSRIEKSLNGATASLYNQRIRIDVNKFTGTLKVTGGSANGVLQFPTHLVESLVSHIPSAESVAEPYTMPEDAEVIVVIDKNSANNLTVPCYRDSVTATGTGLTTIVDATLNTIFTSDSDLNDEYEILVTTGPVSGVRRPISAYNSVTNTITVGSAFPQSPQVGQSYQILPKTAKALVALWNNRKITSLSVRAEVKTASGGTTVQIASKNLGESAAVEVTGGTGNSVLQFPTTVYLGVDGYRYYTGLAQIVQWTVDGRSDDEETYPGVRAAGVQVEVAEPVSLPIRVELTVRVNEGVSLGSLTNDVKSAVSAYVNQLGVGEDVVLSNIVVAVKAVTGVADVKVTVPSANVAVADNELARVTDSNIIVG
ncbi:hypothetical protein EBR03_02975 [bacterium]|nr:hypothetical protein [bacterium]